jgi:methylmalonyl-CoA mutase N-terminal domain/subunit
VEAAALQLIEKIDAMGGSVNAIEEGFMQNEIAKSAYEYQRNIESGEKIIVGVNKFQIEEKNTTPVFKIDESIQSVQVEKLKKLKERRSAQQVAKCLAIIQQNALSGKNLMPAVVEAVENYCTLGEIADELRKVFGEYK